jgi:hypothetical protein
MEKGVGRGAGGGVMAQHGEEGRVTAGRGEGGAARRQHAAWRGRQRGWGSDAAWRGGDGGDRDTRKGSKKSKGNPLRLAWWDEEPRLKIFSTCTFHVTLFGISAGRSEIRAGFQLEVTVRRHTRTVKRVENHDHSRRAVERNIGKGSDPWPGDRSRLKF